jgi:hypothetical protein
VVAAGVARTEIIAETRGLLGEGGLAVRRETRSSVKGSRRNLWLLCQTINGRSDGTTAANSERGRAESWETVAVSSVSIGRMKWFADMVI